MRYSDSAFTKRVALAATVLSIVVGACSDSTSPKQDVGGATLENALRTGVIVSALLPGRFGTLSGGSASDSQVVYVSLRQGMLLGADSVVVGLSSAPLTNVHANLSHGGFDPLDLYASAGDSLNLSAFVKGVASTIRVAIPASSAPTVLRTNPSSGEANVQLGQPISIVFSHPIDASTATPSSIRMSEGGVHVATTVQVQSGQPWIVTLSSNAPLLPRTSYDVVVGSAVADVVDKPLQAPIRFHFSTVNSPLVIDRAMAERNRRSSE